MTNYSAALKLKVESDKQLAKVLSRSVKAIGENLYAMSRDTIAGSERASWYLSCIVPGKSEICSELYHEDYRWLRSRLEIVSRQDIIFDMVELYFKKKINQISTQMQKALYIQITEQLVGYAAQNVSDGFSKRTLTYFIAILVLSSHDFKHAYQKAIMRTATPVIGAASFYGKVQTAALAARKLKAIHTEYYWDLYRNNIEMVYHIIEEPMSRIMFLIDSGSDNEQEITFLINDLVRKK